MENDYLSFKSDRVLRGMNESGIYPSPYNFVGERDASLDEYVVNDSTHSSGIHQHGVLCDPTTYEFYPAHLFGRNRKIEISKLSGRHGVIYVAQNVLGLDISEDDAKRVLAEIKASYSRDGRQTAYSPPELRELILRASGE